MKQKTYIITLSKRFLKGHPKAGQLTQFKDKFLSGEKLHTIKNNYPLWEKRIKEVQEGKAILSIREWFGVPYKEKQVIIKDLTCDDGVGIQMLDCDKPFALEVDGNPLKYQPDMVRLATNDGLSYDDFAAWFDIENATGQKGIIHFTPFRYEYRS